MRHLCVLVCLVATLAAHAASQVWPGEVVGTLSGAVHKYHGEFSDDMFGPGGQVSLQYAPSARIILEPRFGYGGTNWKITPADMAGHMDYFGSGDVGTNYPGTTTTLQPENATSFITLDALFNYVVIPNIPATVMLTAGVGLIDWTTSTALNQPLPNDIAGVYSSSAVSIPVGAAVRIPFSARVGLLARIEHRFVFSDWVDDVNFNSGNDAFTTASIGITYRFTEPQSTPGWYDESSCMPCGDFAWNREVDEDDATLCDPSDDCCEPCDESECEWECCDVCEACCDDCCYGCCYDCCGSCCCCDCSCCGHCNCGAAPAPAEPAKAAPSGGEAPQPPSTPEPPAPGKPSKRFSKDIRFKLDTDEFDFNYPQTQQNLQELLDYMKEAPPGHEVIIEGHASGEGPPERNKVLSDIRAKRIRSYLIEQGVDPSKIRGTVGYGSSMPKVVEPTPAESRRMKPEEVERLRAQNRRIEINVTKDGYEQGS